MDAVEQTKSGPVLRVRVKPSGRRDAVVGERDGRIRVEVRAAPEAGKANAAVIKVVAGWLDLAPSRLALISGSTAKDKRIAVDADDVEARVTTALARLF